MLQRIRSSPSLQLCEEENGLSGSATSGVRIAVHTQGERHPSPGDKPRPHQPPTRPFPQGLTPPGPPFQPQRPVQGLVKQACI